MEKIFSRIGYFGMNGFSALLVPCALCYGKRSLVLTEYARVLDSAAVGHCGEGFKAKINADFAGNLSIGAHDLACEVNVPSTASVLRERSTFNVTKDGAAVPVAIDTLLVCCGAATKLNCAGDKWQPSEGLLPAITRTFADFVTGLGKLSANGRNCVAVQAKVRGTSCRQLDKIERRRPFCAPFEGVFLRIDAVIPNVVTRLRVVHKIFCAAIFNSKLISDMLNSIQGTVTRLEVRGFRNSNSDCPVFMPQSHQQVKKGRFLSGMNAEVSAQGVL